MTELWKLLCKPNKNRHENEHYEIAKLLTEKRITPEFQKHWHFFNSYDDTRSTEYERDHDVTPRTTDHECQKLQVRTTNFIAWVLLVFQRELRVATRTCMFCDVSVVCWKHVCNVFSNVSSIDIRYRKWKIDI